MSSREVVINDVECPLAKARSKPLNRLLLQTIRRMLKTAMYACLARWAFGLAKSLLKFGGSPAKLLKLLNGELFSMNPFKWAAVFGVISSYRGVQQLVERGIVAGSGGNGSIGPAFTLSSLVAGAVSSLGFKAMNNETRTELTLYLFIRSMHGLLSGVVQPKLPPLLRDFEHWDTFTVGLSTIQVFYCLFFQPDAISAKYNTFLRSCTMQDPRVFESLAGIYRNKVVPEMVDFCKAKGYAPPPAVMLPNGTPAGVPMGELCKYFHPPGTPCVMNPINFIRSHFFGFSMKLYLPLKTSTTLIFGWKKCVKDPISQIKKILISSIQSSLFLTGYCGVPWTIICVLTALNIRNPLLICTLGGTLAGLSSFWEPKARRADLGMYIAMNAVRGAYNLLALRGYLNPATMKHITALSLASMALMFYQLEVMPDQLHPNVSSTLKMMIGESKKETTKKKELSEEEKKTQAARQQAVEDF